MVLGGKSGSVVARLATLGLVALGPREATARVAEAQLALIKLPAGFRIQVFSDKVPGARSLARGARGTIFVSTREVGRVYALQDRDRGGKADVVHEIAAGLNQPNGIAFRAGALYVAEIGRILRYDAIEDRLASPPQPVLVSESLPRERWHGWRYIGFGPDDPHGRISMYAVGHSVSGDPRPQRQLFGQRLAWSSPRRCLRLLRRPAG